MTVQYHGGAETLLTQQEAENLQEIVRLRAYSNTDLDVWCERDLNRCAGFLVVRYSSFKRPRGHYDYHLIDLDGIDPAAPVLHFVRLLDKVIT